MKEYYYLHSDNVGENEIKVSAENYYLDENEKYERFEDMITKIQEEDVVFIYHITDLGMDFLNIMKRWTRITKEKRANIVTLSEPIIDTRELKYSRLEYFIYLLHLSVRQYVMRGFFMDFSLMSASMFLKKKRTCMK